MDKKFCRDVGLIVPIISVLLSLTAAVYCIYYIKEAFVPCLITSILISAEATLMTVLVLNAKALSKKSIAFRATLSGILNYAVSVFGVPFLIRHVLNADNRLAASASVILTFIQTVVLLFLWHTWRKSVKSRHFGAAAAGFTLSLCTTVAVIVSSTALPMYYDHYNKLEAAPMGFGKYEKTKTVLVSDADFYVSEKGNDANNGTFKAPFLTLERARDAVRNLNKSGRKGITVALMAGEYRVKTVEFASEDSGTPQCPVTYCAYGDGEVILNGGITLSPDVFKKVSDKAILSRLSDKAKDEVVYTDLTELGLTSDDWGKLYAIGSYNTADKYDGDWVGPIYSELFINDIRQELARYPDEGFLKTGKVLKIGEGRESDGALTELKNWDNLRNHPSDVYQIDAQLAEKISGWKELDNVWMFGFPKYTWADASSPIGEFSAENKTLSPKFVSIFGAIEGAPYYFYNILEELTCRSEWYLDRATGRLYLYPPENMENAQIDLSLSTGSIIKSEASYITFKDLTVKGTRGDAITIEGSGNTVSHCLIKNIAGNALLMTGSDNLASENEITHTGKGGIILDGGDRQTLTSGNNRAVNNLIHDWSEIYQTYQPAVTLNGTGNICAHNEIYNSPHEAITYRGNNHMIEYNLIHDVCLLSDDAGAIYSGRRWDWYGSIIRYNCIYNLGSGEHKPDGIYMDDAVSGQEIYGNLLVNIPKIGIHLGGGRDLKVKNNILINCNDRAFSYDQRAIDGVFGDWFTHAATKDGDMWTNLYSSPWQSEAWKKAYPLLASISDDFENTNSPSFAPNPSNSEVTGNLIVNLKGEIGNISEAANKFSTIDGNAVYTLGKLEKIFTDPANGDYSIKENSSVYKQMPDFEQIPIEKIGRVSPANGTVKG